MSNSSRLDPMPPDRNSGDASMDSSSGGPGDTMEAKESESHIDFLALVQQAERISKNYMQRTIEQPLARSYRAWQNQHASNSKYLGAAYKGRSRLFMPKTRSAVRKNLATAAGALFSTDRVVNVTAEHEDDPIARATAAVMAEDLDMRLTRTTNNTGMPWFMIAMGAALDGQLSGVCITKQFWEYQEVEDGEETVLMEMIDPETGELLIGEDGLPISIEKTQPKFRVTKDRPMSELHPIENSGIDPAAPWYSPAQLGRWFYMNYGMGISDVRSMMESIDKDGNNYWLDVSDEVLQKGRVEEDRSGNRRVREGGSDRYEDGKGSGDLGIVWIRENFIRVDGTDWHFWSVGRHAYLTKPRPVHEVYPELGGERPYTFGFSQLDTHRVFPMSPVESWQSLQLELNDVTNLRQDTLKRSIAPLPMVKRGKNVDLTQMQRRGQPDAVLLVDDPTDVVFTQTPGPSGAAYTETSINNSMFDELAGVFSTSSVQSTRSLNETVGGMQLMSSAANSVSEFDLRIWVETWVEPTLRQIMHLIRYHESDEKLVKIAGQKARAMQQFRYLPGVDDFEHTEISLRVNVGIGAADPMQKLAKLQTAFQMLNPIMPEFKAQGININPEAIIEEVMGAAGFKDGRRFFDFNEDGEKPEEQPNPDLMKVMEEMKLEREKMRNDFLEAILKTKSSEKQTTETNRTRIEIARMNAQSGAQRQMMGIADNQMNRQETRRQKFTEIFNGRQNGGNINVPATRGETSRMPMPQASIDTSSVMMQQVDNQFFALARMAEQMAQRQAATEAALARVAQHLLVPAEIVRDPQTGQPIGVRRGGQFQEITRGPDGRVNRVAPIVPPQGEHQ
jgi:hypothetical protein